jgi:hypothetical protein
MVTVSLVLVLGAFQPPIQAPQEILTEEQFAEAMQEIRATMDDAELHIDAMYWADLSSDSYRLQLLFGQIEAFWTARETQPAVDFSAEAVAGAYALGLTGGEMNGAAATDAVTDLRSLCRSCHTQFRERVDGVFRIKPGT